MPFLYYEIKEEFKNSGMDLEKEIVDYAKVHIKKEFYVPSYFSEIENIPYTEGEKKDRKLLQQQAEDFVNNNISVKKRRK